MSRRVYLDYNASTPVHPEVLGEMLPYFSDVYGNPSSIHGFGREAREGMELARERVAKFLKVASQEIVFTSGGTESDNFAVKGLALAKGKGHLITSQVEHHAVLRACRALEAQGFGLTCVGVDEHGMVDPDEVARDRPPWRQHHARQQQRPADRGDRPRPARSKRAVPYRRGTDLRQRRSTSTCSASTCRRSAHKIWGRRARPGSTSGSTRMVPSSTAASTSGAGAGTENVAGIVGPGKAVAVGP